MKRCALERKSENYLNLAAKQVMTLTEKDRDSMNKLFHKLCNRETVSYLIFGVLTTVINYVTFALMLCFFGEESTLVANGVAFVAAVAFAYITNKLFVFRSKSWAWAVLAREISSFVGARLFSFAFVELGLLVCMWLRVEQYSLFGINGIMIAKIILSFAVVILNYFFSKFFIFKKSGKEKS